MFICLFYSWYLLEGEGVGGLNIIVQLLRCLKVSSCNSKPAGRRLPTGGHCLSHWRKHAEETRLPVDTNTRMETVFGFPMETKHKTSAKIGTSSLLNRVNYTT